MTRHLRVTNVLRDLIRIDTSNPPGRETRAVDYLRTILASSGVECTVCGPQPGRRNLIARLPGADGGPTLAFLCHLDVVPANRDEWSVDPFAGIERDGHIWGRGAVDMKCQLAAVTVALATLAAEPSKLRGDVLLIAVADEEVGDAEVGMPWLVKAHPELRPDYLVGEGAGERYETRRGPLYLLDHGVKQSASATLRVRGASGDASLPRSGDNALLRLGELLDRLDRTAPAVHPVPGAEPLLDVLAPDGGSLERRVELARSQHPALDQLTEALFTNVVTATRASADGPANAVSAEASAHLYIAAVPDATRRDLERELRGRLGDGEYELSVEEPEGGLTSPLETPLRAAIEAFLAEHDPEAQLVPALGYGFSDCHWAREAWGTVAYGFIPFRYGDPLVNLQTKHGADERIRADDLRFQLASALYLARNLDRVRD